MRSFDEMKKIVDSSIRGRTPEENAIMRDIVLNMIKSEVGGCACSRQLGDFKLLDMGIKPHEVRESLSPVVNDITSLIKDLVFK